MRLVNPEHGAIFLVDVASIDEVLFEIRMGAEMANHIGSGLGCGELASRKPLGMIAAAILANAAFGTGDNVAALDELDEEFGVLLLGSGPAAVRSINNLLDILREAIHGDLDGLRLGLLLLLDLRRELNLVLLREAMVLEAMISSVQTLGNEMLRLLV
jgi:hypothetical protein